MKKSVIIVLGSIAFSICSVYAYADTVYQATGNAQGYVCAEGSSADCSHAEDAAKGRAMEDCYAAGNTNCVVEYVNDDSYGGACGPYEHDDYCNASATIRGN